MKLSVVIPVYNEGSFLETTLQKLLHINPYEIIVVDGGSTDNSLDVAKRCNCRILMTQKSRGNQINKGVLCSRGDVVLILHGDTVLSDKVESSDFFLAEDEVGGFFRIKYDSKNFWVKLVEFCANVRSRLHNLPYGDQAIFFKRDIINKIGSFNDYPFLEDLDFVLRLRKVGKIKFVNKNVLVSARKLERKGLLYPLLHSWRNVIIVFLYFLGFKPEKLIKYYK